MRRLSLLAAIAALILAGCGSSASSAKSQKTAAATLCRQFQSKATAVAHSVVAPLPVAVRHKHESLIAAPLVRAYVAQYNSKHPRESLSCT